MKPRRIFHPTDFSPNAVVALRFALEAAHSFRAELHIGHVVFGGTESWDDDQAGHLRDGEHEKHLREYVYSEMVKMSWNSVPPVRLHYPVIRHETPDGGITEYAGSAGIDLIVLGTHGRRGVRRFLLGSVAARVLHAAKSDVVVVPSLYRHVEHARILVPVDLFDRSEPVLRAAGETARLMNGTVDLLHVLEPESDSLIRRSGGNPEIRSLEDVILDQLTVMAESIRNEKTRVRIVPGQPAAAILEYAADNEVGFVMMASSGMSPDARLRRHPEQSVSSEEVRWIISPVTERVVTHADVPVWVVKRFPEPRRPGDQGVDNHQYTMAEIAREL